MVGEIERYVKVMSQPAHGTKIKIVQRSVQQDLEEDQGVEAGKKYVEQGINLNASNMC